MDAWLTFLRGGLLQAGPWAVVLATLAATHVTIVAVTLYLHRSQAHRSLDLHPALVHFFRFWLWLTTGMITREWVAIHRKHHAKCERDGDPHSPVVYGLAQVFFRGAELYRREARNAETLSRYGHGTPDDWIEEHLYRRHNLLGVGLMLVLDILLFGVLGLTVWAVQMAWIPFWAAGVVNGLGHAWGYRNFACPDASTNVVPLGLLIGGEELHNNHHAYASSARFSSKWFELDLGWLYIRLLSMLRLARVRRVAPRLALRHRVPVPIDALGPAQLQGILMHRYEVLARYSTVVAQVIRHELSARGVREAGDIRLLRRCRKWLGQDVATLAPQERTQMARALVVAPVLSTLMRMRRDLIALWGSSSASTEQLVAELRTWCQQAQASGIEGLEQFALRLRCYAV